MEHPAISPVERLEYAFEAEEEATFQALKDFAKNKGQLELLSGFSNLLLAQCFEVCGSDPKILLVILQGCQNAVEEVRGWELKMCFSHFKERLKAGHYVVSGQDRRGSTITWIRLGELYHSFGGLARYQTGSQRYYAALRSYFWYVIRIKRPRLETFTRKVTLSRWPKKSWSETFTYSGTNTYV
jgi:hypothetical protein